jgi:hypothetical protein
MLGVAAGPEKHLITIIRHGAGDPELPVCRLRDARLVARSQDLPARREVFA